MDKKNREIIERVIDVTCEAMIDAFALHLSEFTENHGLRKQEEAALTHSILVTFVIRMLFQMSKYRTGKVNDRIQKFNEILDVFVMQVQEASESIPEYIRKEDEFEKNKGRMIN